LHLGIKKVIVKKINGVDGKFFYQHHLLYNQKI